VSSPVSSECSPASSPEPVKPPYIDPSKFSLLEVIPIEVAKNPQSFTPQEWIAKIPTLHRMFPFPLYYSSIPHICRLFERTIIWHLDKRDKPYGSPIYDLTASQLILTMGNEIWVSIKTIKFGQNIFAHWTLIKDGKEPNSLEIIQHVEIKDQHTLIFWEKVNETATEILFQTKDIPPKEPRPPRVKPSTENPSF